MIRDNFCQFGTKTFIVTPHLNQDDSDEWSQHMVSMSSKNNYPLVIIKYSSYLQL